MNPGQPQPFQVHETPSQPRLTASFLFFKFIRPCVAEFLATMFLVFADLASSRFSSSLTPTYILFALVAATANVSGGHVNPAVSLTMTFCRGLKPILLPFYFLSQMIGGIVGAKLAEFAVGDDMGYAFGKDAVYALGDHVEPLQAILAEMLATSILVLTVLMVAFDERNKSVLGPLAIGFAFGGGILAIREISGASMNPARSFGPAIVQGYWKNHYVYWVGPTLGSVFSTLIYSLVFATPDKLWIPVHEPIN